CSMPPHGGVTYNAEQAATRVRGNVSRMRMVSRTRRRGSPMLAPSATCARTVSLIGRSVLATPAPSATPATPGGRRGGGRFLLALGLLAVQFGRQLVGGQLLRTCPPCTQLMHVVRLAATQQQEVVGGTKAGVFQQPEGALAGASFKARLQNPYFLHAAGEPTRNRDVARLLGHHPVTAALPGQCRLHAFVDERLHGVAHFAPQEHG